MGHCGEFFNAVWATTVNFILLCAMGHCGEFGYMLWANAADLVMRHGQLRGMKPYSKDLYRFLRYGP
jgi:hypothetical protein